MKLLTEKKQKNRRWVKHNLLGRGLYIFRLRWKRA